MASQKDKETRSWQQSILLYVHDLMCMLLVVMLLFLVVFRVILVTGDSMFATLWDGDYLLLVSELFCGDPEPGDIVVISKQSFDEGKPIVKRVIATEGQTVDIDFESGTDYVDGKAQQTLANGIRDVMGTADINVDEPDSLTLDLQGKAYDFVIHNVNSTSGDYLGAAVESTTLGFGGDLKVLVGFDAQGKVLGYTILQASETPGLGAKADKWFQKDGKGSIIGRSLADGNLTVDKDGGDVDAITPSTITTRAFLKAVNQAYAAYKGNNASNVRMFSTFAPRQP